MTSADPNLVVVCGPTASGKTHLGVAIARRLNGEIISVDSRQVYRGLDLGAGKDLREYGDGGERVAHHLIDIADLSDVYTLWRFQADFYGAFREIRGRGRMPVAVGGTGLYLEAALRNYRVPNVAEDPALRADLMAREKSVLEAMLREQAPWMIERTDLSSRKRIVRAIEVAVSAGRQEVRWGHEDPPDLHPLVLGVRWERSRLRERIRERLDQRLAEGILDEVRGLLDRGVSAKRLDSLGLEYRHLARHLADATAYGTMRDELFADICRFAKRQETYLRGMERRGVPIRWVDNADESAALREIRANVR